MIQLTNLRVSVLLGVQLDDETLFDGQIDIFSGGNSDDFADHVVRVEVKPLGDDVVRVCLEIDLEALDAAAALFECDDHAGLHLIAGDVDLAAVDGVKNVLELKAPVLQVKPLQKSEFVGYSATFRAPQDMKIAIVSIGYGDGLPRSLSNRGKVVFYEQNQAHFCPILGRVSMDNIICDVSSLKEIKTGDFGYLINDDYTVDDIARDAGTIAYELISNLGKNPRFIRSYQG